MRDIKFRAWDNKGKRMIPWIEIKKDKWMLWDMFNGNGHPIIPRMVFYIPMQYTGLKDFNGREIYDGDICSESYDGVSSESIGIIIFNDAGFKYNCIETTFCEFLIRIVENLEVIGNIYENPELVEKT